MQHPDTRGLPEQSGSGCPAGDLAHRFVDLTHEAPIPLKRAVLAADPVTRIAAATDVQALMRARGAVRDQKRLRDWGSL